MKRRIHIGEPSIDELSHELTDCIAERFLDRQLSADERLDLTKIVQARIEDAIRQARDAMKTTTRSPHKTTWTPPELAREWGVSPDKILGWIRSGELPATNVASSMSGRPRYCVDAEAIKTFRARRSIVTKPTVARRRREPSNVIEFF